MGKCPFMHLDDTKVLSGANVLNEPPMRYSDYLHLGPILDSQQPLSDVHDEMLFIIQHQTSELWMKLLLHELSRACGLIARNLIPQAVKTLSRTQKTIEHLVHAWGVLATLTPSEFLAMRPALGSASGHQSFQFREIEFVLGNKNAAMLQEYVAKPSTFRALQNRLKTPSLYDEVIQAMALRGFDIEPARLDVDPSLPTCADASVKQAWITIYRDTEKHWDMYILGERLVDLEEGFRHWRYRHVATVERMIGMRKGTGGSDGVGYLRETLEVILFPELWQLRTAL